MKTLFLINARSGTNRHRDLRSLIRAECRDADLAIEECERKEDLDAIVSAAREGGCETVIAVGGDGTVHEIAKRLIGTSLALGVVPTGSGNGFARHHRIPTNARTALRALREARPATIDTATVNGLPFIGVMGIGFDAYVAHRFAEHGTRGLRAYVSVGVRGLASFTGEQIEVEIDGVAWNEDVFIAAVANTSEYGNGARVAPHASSADGLLDLVIVRRPSLVHAPLLAMRLFAGSFDRGRHVTTRRAKEITIRRSAAGAAHVDGEPIHLPEELHIVIRERSLRVLVPAGVERM